MIFQYCTFKFFHPDPTVKRQSGLLKPQLNNSNIQFHINTLLQSIIKKQGLNI